MFFLFDDSKLVTKKGGNFEDLIVERFSPKVADLS
jgi:hypothetical protein